MSDPNRPSGAERDAAFAAVLREFVDGLPQRLLVLRTALEGLARGEQGDLLETLHVRAHSLKGTAAAFGALEVSACARAVEDRAHRWVRGGAVRRDELPAARDELRRLEQAAAAYAAGAFPGGSR